MHPGKIALVPLISILTGALVLIVVAFVLYQPKNAQNSNLEQNTNQAACAQDAKICPDGSTVGRVPPDCQFSTCPLPGSTNTNESTNVNANANTNTSPERYVNEELGFAVNLSTSWIVDSTRSSVDEIVFTDGLATENREAVKTTSTTQTLTEWTGIYSGEDGYRVTDYTLDGQPAKRVRFNGIGADFIGVKVDGRLYVITVGRMETNGMLATLDLLP